MKIEDLGLSIRSTNILKRNGITTVEELMLQSQEDLKSLKNMGPTALTEIINKKAEITERGLEDEEGESELQRLLREKEELQQVVKGKSTQVKQAKTKLAALEGEPTVTTKES